MELTERGVRHWALGRAGAGREREAEHGQSLPHCCPGGLDITNTSILGILVRKYEKLLYRSHNFLNYLNALFQILIIDMHYSKSLVNY